MRVVSRQQQIVRLDQEEMFSSEDAELLAERFAAVYQNYDVILFSDYNKGSLQQISKMIKLAKAAAGDATTVLRSYHGTLVPPFCNRASREYFSQFLGIPG